MTTDNDEASQDAQAAPTEETSPPFAEAATEAPATAAPATAGGAEDASPSVEELLAQSDAAATEGGAAPRRPRGRRERHNVPRGRAYVQSTFNNTLITLTDNNGDVIAWSSAGSTGTKGSRKSTPFAAQMAAETAARKAMDSGMREIDVYVKGPGSGRESAVRALQAAGLTLSTIRDITPIPHNGCRPRKRRRV